MSKLCNKCHIEKDETEFYIKKGGLDTICKTCNRAYSRQYNLTHKEQYKQYYQAHKEQHSIEMKTWYQNNKEQHTIKMKEWYKENKEQHNKNGYNYRQQNKEKINQQRKEKYNTDISYRLSFVFSGYLRKTLNGNKKYKHWEDIVPYTLEELKKHLESQFDENMSWDNYGDYWEIDHIIPINIFNFTTYQDKEFQVCWSLTNLRPLEKSLNRQRPKDGSDISENLKQQILNNYVAGRDKH